MIREKNYKLKRLRDGFPWKQIQEEYHSLLMIRDPKKHHQHRTEKLAPGVTEYHTGGWEEILLTYHQNGCQFIPELQQMPETLKTIQWFQAMPTRIKFSVLQAGHKINPHVGNQEESEYCRFHIPIITNALCTFHVESETYQPGLGELWYLNSTRLHWVENNSTEDRVHLIMDFRPNDWVSNLMLSSLIL